VFLRVFFGEKIKNKVFCLKIDDFLNVFGFLVDYAEVLKNEFARGKSHVNEMESFWGYAKTRLSKFRGMDKNMLCYT
jgi:transposase